MATPNPARLSAISSKCLTLAMERQRLLSISPPSQSLLSPTKSAGSSSSMGQIIKNMMILREGIEAIENNQGSSKATRSLREQYSNILSILGEDEVAAAGLQTYVRLCRNEQDVHAELCVHSSLPPPPQKQAEPLIPERSTLPQPDSPFQDVPEQADHEVFQTQKQIMRGKDAPCLVLSLY